jgi:hypothetical protein
MEVHPNMMAIDGYDGVLQLAEVKVIGPAAVVKVTTASQGSEPLSE